MQKLRRQMVKELRMRKPMILLNPDAGVNDQGVAQDPEAPGAQDPEGPAARDVEVPVEGDNIGTGTIAVIGVHAYNMMQATLEGLKEVVGE